MMRCFVAVELDHATRRPLVKLIDERLPRTRDVRWCTGQQLHVTLKFLGEVREQDLQPVCAVVKAAADQVTPFPLALTRLGAFPNARSPRVMWCGVRDDHGGCRRWLELADPLLADLGFERESRAFSPHITLGRGKSAAGARLMREQLESLASPTAPETLVREVVLYESLLKPGGAEYRPLLTASLQG
ncbi:MAG: RNA 2',3'-cyclic phosphodiesterase [Phycisphaerae bacterium]|nr:RNA 2',3'-cyclic phosphodiesterase [Phycisphaerae bacterium]